MSFDRKIAWFVTHCRRQIYIGLVILILACAGLLVCCMHLDSEVLNLLPGSFDSVQALKTYNRDFSQNKELIFAVYDKAYDKDHPGVLDEFADHFSTTMRKQPWVLRVTNSAPSDDPDAMDDVSGFAVPLLLNLPSSDFDRAISQLDPAAMQARLHKLKSDLEMGSMRAEMELNLDPLGLVTSSLKPLKDSFSEDQSQSFVSKSGKLHLVFVITDQQDLGPYGCQAMMKKVDDVKKQVYATWQGDTSRLPEILVTGRTPYVAEMSAGMENDIVVTLLGSVFLVSAIFYIGFRRVRPLVAIMVVLLLCCIISVAAGGVIFRALNGITIGFCSILVGLGVDFGMLLYGSYQSQRNEGNDHETAVAGAIRQIGKGVIFGASTTAAGFLALVLSNCAGFSQLGVLIAIGILLSALLMMTVFFVFMGPDHSPRQHDWLFNRTLDYVGVVFRSPRPFIICTGLLLLGLNIFAFLPVKELIFQVDPKSLEPHDSKPGFALRLINSEMNPSGVEPVLVIADAKDGQEFYDHWMLLQAHWNEALKEHKIKSITSPAPFLTSPAQMKENAARLVNVNFAAARDALSRIIGQEGFAPDAFKKSYAFIDSLAAVAKGDTRSFDWRNDIPENSSLRFLLEHVLASEPDVAVAYITPNERITSESKRIELEKTLQTPGVPIHISGWSYTLANLIPWSKAKLAELSIVMVAFNILLLIFLYRKFFPLFILMLSLFLSIGAMVASLKIFEIPLNLFNVLAFPLVLGVGVDYGIYVLLAFRKGDNKHLSLTTILKPVLLSGLCTICGFGSLVFAHNPSLSGLGEACALGVMWSLFTTLFFILPVYVWKGEQ